MIKKCNMHSWFTHSEVPEDQVSRAPAQGHESRARVIHNCFGFLLCRGAACLRRGSFKDNGTQRASKHTGVRDTGEV